MPPDGDSFYKFEKNCKQSHSGRESMYKMLSASGNPKLASFTKVIQGLGLKLKLEQDPQHRASI